MLMWLDERHGAGVATQAIEHTAVADQRDVPAGVATSQLEHSLDRTFVEFSEGFITGRGKFGYTVLPGIKVVRMLCDSFGVGRTFELVVAALA